MSTNKKIPQASVRRDTRVSKPRNPESITLPGDQGTVRDDTAKIITTTDIPSVGDEIAARKPQPQQAYDPSKAGSTSRGSFFDIPPGNIVDDAAPDFRVDNPLFEPPPATTISIIDDNVPVISPVEEPQPSAVDIDRVPSSVQDQNITDRNNPNYGNRLPENSRRRAPPPVSFNPGASISDPNQIPSAPGIRNFPKQWENLPENFQSQLRRLLPIYYDVTGPISNLLDIPPYVPPPLFDTTPTFEGETGEEELVKNETEAVAPMEPPNRSSLDFLNFLNFLFDLILSADSDVYEVVSFTRIEDGGATSPDVPVAGGDPADTPSSTRYTTETRDFPDGTRRRVVLDTDGNVVRTLSADRTPPPQNEIPSTPFLSSPGTGAASGGTLV